MNSEPKAPFYNAEYKLWLIKDIQMYAQHISI